MEIKMHHHGPSFIGGLIFAGWLAERLDWWWLLLIPILMVELPGLKLLSWTWRKEAK